MVYLLTATGLSVGGSTTVHIDTQTVHRTTQITTNLEVCGLGPVFANFALAFALQLRKKHGKTSVRLQHTYYQNTHTLRNLLTHTHTHTPTHTTRPHILVHTHTHTPTHNTTRPHTHTHTHHPTRQHTHTHANTHTYTNKHHTTRPHKHTHTHKQWLGCVVRSTLRHCSTTHTHTT